MSPHTSHLHLHFPWASQVRSSEPSSLHPQSPLTAGMVWGFGGSGSIEGIISGDVNKDIVFGSCTVFYSQ